MFVCRQKWPHFLLSFCFLDNHPSWKSLTSRFHFLFHFFLFYFIFYCHCQVLYSLHTPSMFQSYFIETHWTNTLAKIQTCCKWTKALSHSKAIWTVVDFQPFVKVDKIPKIKKIIWFIGCNHISYKWIGYK